MTTSPGPLRAALAQVNTTVGDIDGNAELIAAAIGRAREADAHLVVFPELALTGYPPEDLLLKTDFLRAARAALDGLAEEARDIVALVGFPEGSDDVYNAAAVLADGRVAGVYRKMLPAQLRRLRRGPLLPGGHRPAVIEVNGVQVGLTVCEDMWEPGRPATLEALAGARVMVNLSASPYHFGKGAERERMLLQRARDNQAAVLFCNSSAARTSWSSTATAWRSTRRERSWPAPPSSRRRSRRSTWTPARWPPPGCATRAAATTCAGHARGRLERVERLASSRSRRRARRRSAVRWPSR